MEISFPSPLLPRVESIGPVGRAAEQVARWLSVLSHAPFLHGGCGPDSRLHLRGVQNREKEDRYVWNSSIVSFLKRNHVNKIQSWTKETKLVRSINMFRRETVFGGPGGERWWQRRRHGEARAALSVGWTMSASRDCRNFAARRAASSPAQHIAFFPRLFRYLLLLRSPHATGRRARTVGRCR